MKSDQEIVPDDREDFSSNIEPAKVQGMLGRGLSTPHFIWNEEEFILTPPGKAQHEIGN
jgi:hypothetical protein